MLRTEAHQPVSQQPTASPAPTWPDTQNATHNLSATIQESVALHTPKKPNLFVLGAGKSGTTSLYMYLAAHPEIFMSPVKEPTFFSDCFQVVADPITYLQLFQKATHQRWIGEASHAYLSHPGAADCLKACFPESRFIVILRNPADRALSLYRHMALHGDECSPTFEAALAAEECRVADPAFYRGNPQYYYNFLYVRSGLYCEQIERYFARFTRERFLFLTFDELSLDPRGTVRRMYEFLDVDAAFVPPLEVHNASRFVDSARRQYWLKHRIKPWLVRLAGRRGATLADRLMDRNRAPARPAPMHPVTRQRLARQFSAEVANLETLIHRDLSAWKAAEVAE